jgi:hypothetical protein
VRFVLFILSYYMSFTLLVPCYDVLCKCLIRSRNCLPIADTYVHLRVYGPYWALFLCSLLCCFFVFCFIFLLFACLCSVSCAQYCLRLRIVYSWLSFGFPLGLFISIQNTHCLIFNVILLSVRLMLGGSAYWW